MTEGALKAYLNAKKVSDVMKPTNPTKLCFLLNYSKFMVEIQGNYESAVNLMESSYNLALNKLSLIENKNTHEVTKQLQIFKSYIKFIKTFVSRKSLLYKTDSLIDSNRNITTNEKIVY